MQYPFVLNVPNKLSNISANMDMKSKLRYRTVVKILTMRDKHRLSRWALQVLIRKLIYIIS